MTIRIPDVEDRKLEYSKDRVDKVSGGTIKKVGVKVKEAFAAGGYTGSNVGQRSTDIDIAYLDTPSLDRYLRSKGGRNDLAEDIVKKLLGHEPVARQE